jgi:hypothetical protein
MLEELLEERVVRKRNRQNPRGVKRKMSKFPIRRPGSSCRRDDSLIRTIVIIK